MAKTSKKKPAKQKSVKLKAKRGRSLGQLLSLAVALAILVGISVTATLMLTGVIAMRDPGIGAIPSINEAKTLCDKEIREERSNLRSFHLDDRSSHLHTSSNHYKLFYEMDVFNGKTAREGVKQFYVNCFVDAAKGRVISYEEFEQEDFQPPAIRKSNGNAFGM